MGVCFEFDIEASAVNLINNEDATFSHAVSGSHVKSCLIIFNYLEGHVIFCCKQEQTVSKALAWLVFKYEEDFEEELFLHLVKKAVF